MKLEIGCLLSILCFVNNQVKINKIKRRQINIACFIVNYYSVFPFPTMKFKNYPTKYQTEQSSSSLSSDQQSENSSQFYFLHIRPKHKKIRKIKRFSTQTEQSPSSSDLDLVEDSNSLMRSNLRKKTGDNLLSKKNEEIEAINAKALQTLRIMNKMKEKLQVNKGEENQQQQRSNE